MRHDNQHTNKKLQELEEQSLPDLTKMDYHWQQMVSQLKPGTVNVTMKKNSIAKKAMLICCCIVIIIIIIFFSNANSGDSKELSTNGIEISSNNNFSDTAKTDAVADTVPNQDNIYPSLTASIDNKLLLEKFYEQIRKKPLLFRINNLRDTTIYGKEGTKLYIPAHSFNTEENLTVLLTEFYSVSDMIAQKLTTTCDGHRLITGGMIYLDVRDKNQGLVNLNNGSSLRLDIPMPDNQLPMELFYGYDYYRNDTTEVIDSINWQRTNQPFSIRDNVGTSSLIINNPKQSVTRDTLFVSEKVDPILSFDYMTTDTVMNSMSDSIYGISINTKPTAPAVIGDSIVLKRFGVNIRQLGWINCDRFYNDPRPKTELIVDLGDNAGHYNTLLVFDKFTSIMRPSSTQGNLVKFFNLPMDESAKIVSIGIKNGSAVTAMEQVTISKKHVIEMTFDEISPSAFRQKLDQ